MPRATTMARAWRMDRRSFAPALPPTTFLQFILRRAAPKDLRCLSETNATSDYHGTGMADGPEILRSRPAAHHVSAVYPEARSAEGSPVPQQDECHERLPWHGHGGWTGDSSLPPCRPPRFCSLS